MRMTFWRASACFSGLIVAFFSAAASATTNGELAAERVAHGECQAALDPLNAGIADGEPRAYWLLGMMHSRGYCLKADPARAVSYLEAAAQHGQDDAAMELVRLYGLGRGVPQNYAEAGRWAVAGSEIRGAAETRAAAAEPTQASTAPAAASAAGTSAPSAAASRPVCELFHPNSSACGNSMDATVVAALGRMTLVQLRAADLYKYVGGADPTHVAFKVCAIVSMTQPPEVTVHAMTRDASLKQLGERRTLSVEVKRLEQALAQAEKEAPALLPTEATEKMSMRRDYMFDL